MYIYAVIIIHNGRFRFLPSISSLSCDYIDHLLRLMIFDNLCSSFVARFIVWVIESILILVNGWHANF